MAGLLLLGNFLRDRDENVHCQKAHAILVIACEVLEKGYHFVDNHLRIHLLDKLGEVVGGLAANHGGFIMYQGSEVLSEALLHGRCGLFVWCRVQAGGGDLGSKPVGFGEVEDQGDKVLFDLTLVQLLADFVEGFDGLISNDQRSSYGNE
jgi:hypothetical protein